MPRFKNAFALVVCVLLASRLAAQDDLGTIDFPTSGTAEAQENFIRGVLFLHSFEYESAARAFRRAQNADPDFAMAYWGEAMTHNHPIWMEQDRDAARAVLARLAPTADERRAKAPTGREKSYLDVIEILYGQGDKASRDTAYSQAMARFTSKYPDDHNAAAFYALSILGTSHGGRDFATYMRAAAVVEEVFDENPHHPGAVHYLIHSYDDPIHAPLGLRAATIYSKIAPAAAHAQHMTSHIFLALGMWDDVVAANEVASAQIDGRLGHYTSWLEYGYLQQGRYDEVLERVREAQRQATKSGTARLRRYFANLWAVYMMDTRRWNGVVARMPVDTTGVGSAAARVAFVRGVVALESGDRSGVQNALRHLLGYAPESTGGILHKELEALTALSDGRTGDALASVAEATARQDALPLEFGPPVVLKPSHELFGDILLELNRLAEAQREFERSLALTPKRALALLGLARSAANAGDAETSQRAYAELRAVWHRADADLRELEEVRSGGVVSDGSGR